MTGITSTMRLIIGVAILAVIVIAIFSVRGCLNARQDARQAKQDTKSAEAYAGAAQEAVAVVVARSDEEADVDQIVAQASKEIDNAKDPAAARAAVLAATCRMRLYRDRPECAVQPANP